MSRRRELDGVATVGRVRRIGVFVALALTLAPVAACAPGGGAGEPAGLELPPRPRDVRIDGVEPCSLLTEQQRLELGLDGKPAASTRPSVLFKGDETVCIVRGYSPRAVSVGVGVVTTSGIELLMDGQIDADVRAVKVREFPAIVVTPTKFSDFCSVMVDVAPGQILDVQYADGGREPPISQQQLCQGAEQVAGAAMTNLVDR